MSRIRIRSIRPRPEARGQRKAPSGPRPFTELRAVIG